MNYAWAVLLCLLVGCGDDKEPKDPLTPAESVAVKYGLYLELSTEKLSVLDNWVDKNCDSFLFSGLRSAYSFVNLEDGFLGKGKIGRRNHKMFSNCLTTGESASTGSQDGLLGLAEFALTHNRKDLVADVLDYVKVHGSVGDGDPGRTTVNPDVMGTMAQIAGKDIWQTKLPVAVGPVTGFRRHLMAMHLHMRAKQRGGMQAGVYHDWLREQEGLQPRNPLYSLLVARYITGDYEKTYALLMDETFWPNDRLPTGREFCGGEWVTQRDAGDSWKPCKDEDPDSSKEWSGSDWLYVACYALGRCG